MRIATTYLGDRGAAIAPLPRAARGDLRRRRRPSTRPMISAHPRPRRPRLQLPPAGPGGLRAAAAAGDRARRRAAADLHPADRQRRHLRADRALLLRLRRARLRALRPLAVPARAAADGAARPPALPGPDLRRRRQPASTCSRSGRRTTSARSSASPGARGSSSPARAPGRCAGSRPGSPNRPGKPAAAAGLGLLDGSLCVHYNNEPERRAAYLDAVGNGMPGGYGLDDYAGLLWEGERDPLGPHRPPRRPRLPGHAGRGRRRPSRRSPPASCPPRPPRPCARTSPSSAASPGCASAAGWLDRLMPR